MTCPGLGMEAFGASWRFSPLLRWSSGCSQLLQKGRHGPSYLRQRQHRVARWETEGGSRGFAWPGSTDMKKNNESPEKFLV